MRRLALLLFMVVCGVCPQAAHAYGWGVVGITVEGDSTGAWLDFDGDTTTGNHLVLERRGKSTLRASVGVGEAIGLGEPDTPWYAGARCTRVDAERIVDCDLRGLRERSAAAPWAHPVAIDEVSNVDVHGDLGGSLFVERVHQFSGGDEDDYVYALGAGDLLEGNGGDDVLVGSAGVDTLRGGDGDDDLMDSGQADVLDAGPGDDVVRVRVHGYDGYVDAMVLANPDSTCGTGNDLVWGLMGSETSPVPDCERRSGPTITSAVLPAGVAPVGRTLSVASTTTGSPIERTDVTWHRCPPLPTDQWFCPQVGSGPTYVVTADDQGFSLLAAGTTGWLGPGGSVVGFWFERRTAVEPRPTPSPAVTATPTPTVAAQPKPTPTPSTQVLASDLASRLRTALLRSGARRSVANGRLTIALPAIVGAPAGSTAAISILTKRRPAAVIGTTSTRLDQPGSARITLNRRGRSLLKKHRSVSVTTLVVVSTPDGTTARARGALVLRRR